MEKRPTSSTMSFGGLEQDEKYKRLMRLVKQAQNGQRSSSGRNDFENTEASLSISSIAPESNEFLQARQLLESSKTGSYVIASSTNRGRMHLDGPIGKGCAHRQPLAMSSVKGRSKARKEAICCMHDSSLSGLIQRHDRTREIPNEPSYSKKEALSCEKPTSKYSRTSVAACFTDWTIMLNKQSKLVIKGNLVGKSYCQSKPILRKVCAKMVEGSNKCLYTMEGNLSDKNNELPSYVRRKFCTGFPDDWESVYQVWLTFNRQGSPLNFHWPTDLADSDDDLTSEITDDRVECHLANFAQFSQEFSEIEANCSALSGESLSSMQLPATTTSPIATFERGEIIGQRSEENEKEAGMDDSEKETAVADLGAKSLDPDKVDRPEKNETLDICEEIGALYKQFHNLFDRLRRIHWKCEKIRSLHSYREEASSPGKMRTVKENNGSNEPPAKDEGGVARRKGLATSSMPVPVPIPIGIQRKDYQSAERPLAKMSVNSDESESEMYAGVRKIPLGIILSGMSRRHISDERKHPTLTRRASRDSYVRRTRRIRSVNSFLIYRSEEKEESKKEDAGGLALQNKYGVENENGYGRGTLTRMPLSQIDASGMNVELNAVQFNTHQPAKSRSNPTKARLPGQWRSMPVASRCAPVRRDARDAAAPLNTAVTSRKTGEEGSLESFYSRSCQLTSRTTSETIGRASRIPAGTGQHLISEEQLTHHRTVAAAPKIETTGRKWPVERNEPVQRVSTGKSNNSNANAKGNSAARCDELEAEAEAEAEAVAEEKVTLRTAHLSNEKVKEQQGRTVQLLKSWLPSVVPKSSSDLDGELIFHGELICGAGHRECNVGVTTNYVRRRLSRSCIETLDSQVYKLVGEMVDPGNTVPKGLLAQCRDGCPSRIKDFCKAWLAVSLPTTKDSKSAGACPQRGHAASTESPSVLFSSKGRRILPPLSYWTGERVLLKDNNPVYSPGIVVADRKGEEKSEGGTSGDRPGRSAKRTLSRSADSNDESTHHPIAHSGKKRRRTEASRGGTAESSRFNATAARRSKLTNPMEVSGMGQQPSHHRPRTAKLLDLSDQEDGFPVTIAPVEKLKKARGRPTPGSTTRQEKSDKTEKSRAKPAPSPEHTRRQALPNHNSSTVKRRKEKVSYNLYKNCPSEEDALSDDQLTHV